MAHKDFAAYEPEPDEKGPTFAVAGEAFTCLPVLPAGAFVELPFGPLSADDASRFILRCLVPEDRRRFADLLLRGLDDVPSRQAVEEGTVTRHPIIEPKLLGDITRWLLGSDGAALTPFALTQQEQSRGGAGPTGTTSGAESGTPGSTSSG